jgi:hypothetical protein
MGQIATLLAAGDRRTKGKSETVVKQVLAEPGKFGEVMEAMLAADPGTRMRAADAAEKISRVHPEWLRRYKPLLLKQVARIDQQEVRWHAAQMLPRLNLTRAERKKVFALLLTYLDHPSRIVRTFAMQALADIARQDGSYTVVVRGLLKRLTKQGSPAMQARGRKLIAMLGKMDT